MKIHPLDVCTRFSTYRFPDPDVCMGIGPVDWFGEKRRIEASKAMGKFTYGGLRHGRTCLQLSDIRGYENMMFVMAD